MEATAFRRWTCSSNDDCVESQEVVPGLRRVLENVGLASYRVAAELWCQEMGAAFLADVAEEVDEFVAALDVPERGQGAGLVLSKREQLYRELLAQLEGARRTAKEAEPPSLCKSTVVAASSFYDPDLKVNRKESSCEASEMIATPSGQLQRTLATSFSDLYEIAPDLASEETQPNEEDDVYGEEDEEEDSEGSEGGHPATFYCEQSASSTTFPARTAKW